MQFVNFDNSDGDGDPITVTTETSSGNHYVRINGGTFDIGNVPAAEPRRCRGRMTRGSCPSMSCAVS